MTYAIPILLALTLLAGVAIGLFIISDVCISADVMVRMKGDEITEEIFVQTFRNGAVKVWTYDELLNSRKEKR